MSLPGQKLTWRLQFVMSPLPPKSDIACAVVGSTILGVQDNENHLPRAPPTAELRRLWPGAKFACSSSEFPCYALGISLFRSAGNFALAIEFSRRSDERWSSKGPDSRKFPVYFPVSREFGLETGWHLTASSASQSGLSNKLRLSGRNAHGSAAFAGSGSVSAFRIRSRICHSRRRSPEAIFGVSFSGAVRPKFSTESERSALVGPVERYAF